MGHPMKLSIVLENSIAVNAYSLREQECALLLDPSVVCTDRAVGSHDTMAGDEGIVIITHDSPDSPSGPRTASMARYCAI